MGKSFHKKISCFRTSSWDICQCLYYRGINPFLDEAINALIDEVRRTHCYRLSKIAERVSRHAALVALAKCAFEEVSSYGVVRVKDLTEFRNNGQVPASKNRSQGCGISSAEGPVRELFYEGGRAASVAWLSSEPGLCGSCKVESKSFLLSWLALRRNP